MNLLRHIRGDVGRRELVNRGTKVDSGFADEFSQIFELEFRISPTIAGRQKGTLYLSTKVECPLLRFRSTRLMCWRQKGTLYLSIKVECSLLRFLVGTWTYSKAFNLQAGYFWFFYGDAVTQGPLARPNAEQFYLQATYAF